MPPTAITRRSTGGFVGVLKMFAQIVVMVLLIKTVAFEPFNIPSGSMIPTLLVGDYLFVSKYSYGYSRFSPSFIPLPSFLSFQLSDFVSSLLLFHPPPQGRVFGALPKRGDVAVFKLPRDTSTDYIKRIMGLPGDTLQMRSGRLYINGAELPRTPDGTYLAEGEGPPILEKRYIETLPDGRQHPILKMGDHQMLDDTEEFHVPPGYVFAMGDNRDNSLDSRVPNGVGYIPLENLVGRAEFIFLSIDTSKFPLEVRWDRLFKGIS